MAHLPRQYTSPVILDTDTGISTANGNPDRINGTWALRRISSVIVNNDESEIHTLYQKDTHKSITLSSPLLLPLKRGKNIITIGGLYNGKDYHGADIEKVVVYPPEGDHSPCDKWWVWWC